MRKEQNENDAGFVTCIIMTIVGLAIIMWYYKKMDEFIIALQIVGGIILYLGGGFVMFKAIFKLMERYR